MGRNSIFSRRRRRVDGVGSRVWKFIAQRDLEGFTVNDMDSYIDARRERRLARQIRRQLQSSRRPIIVEDVQGKVGIGSNSSSNGLGSNFVMYGIMALLVLIVVIMLMNAKKR